MSHATEILHRIEEDILSGALEPGDRLDERRLAERFGVSRTPVREALQRLAAAGVVTLQARQGASVAELDVVDLFDAFTVVAELEAIAAQQAAHRIRPEEREALSAAHAACERAARAGDAEAFNAANDRFHAAILAASQNRVLSNQIRSAQLLTAPARRRITLQPGRMAASIGEHEAILSAILSADGPAAAERMRGHVNQLGAGAADVLRHLSHAAARPRRLTG